MVRVSWGSGGDADPCLVLRYLIPARPSPREAGYLDEVELLAVDHPADVEIYSNEKVGPAKLAKFQIHTVRERRSPVTARNSAGRDVLPDVR